eukprot:scaffold5570_cov78-Cylindrotheca_fusiformis.AAC.3
MDFVTIISFFQNLALILFMTIVQATIGSFIVFLTLTDCIGPAHPTYLVDNCLASVMMMRKKKKENDALDSDEPSKKDPTMRTQTSRSDSNAREIA